MIVSEVDGRIRVRANRLKSRKIAGSVKNKIEQIQGVGQVRTNIEACSIIVHYDSKAIDTIELEDKIVEIVTPKGNSTKKKNGKLSQRLGQATKIGMMGTLATSLAYGYIGQKKNHIRYGTAFVALAGMHMLKHSTKLLK